MTVPPGWKPLPDQGQHLETGERVRPFRASDFLDKSVLCPHCGQFMRVVGAAGPYVSYNTSIGAIDACFYFDLEDGGSARFWCDGKGLVEPAS